MKKQGLHDVLVVVGGIIPDEDLPFMHALGIHGIFGPGTSTQDIINFVREHTAGLSATSGTEQARWGRLSCADGDTVALLDQLLAGERRALARVISCVEDQGPEARVLLAGLYPHTGRAHVVGITGAPGTGKSSLVNALARAYAAQGLTAGIIAIDPTSPFSGGALLGDRVRMRDLAGDPGTFHPQHGDPGQPGRPGAHDQRSSAGARRWPVSSEF